jgi:hypothetical protein
MAKPEGNWSIMPIVIGMPDASYFFFYLVGKNFIELMQKYLKSGTSLNRWLFLLMGVDFERKW